MAFIDRFLASAKSNSILADTRKAQKSSSLGSTSNDNESTGLDRKKHEQLVSELETELFTIMRVWFPRAVDTKHGGFLCHFDRDWKSRGANCKMLEFQARMTRVAAAAAAYKGLESYVEFAEHGVKYLEQVMWDSHYGGFFRMADRSGQPLESFTKHAHGMAYCINALSSYYRLTREESALDLANRAFRWIEAAGYDTEHGGYFGFYARDGKPILSSKDCPIEHAIRDSLGTPLGLKDINTNVDMLSGLYDLSTILSDDLLKMRINELFLLIRDKLIVSPGALHVHYNRDWIPIPEFNHYGYSLTAFNILSKVAHGVGTDKDAATSLKLKTLIDNLLQYGWDRNLGGFFFGGSTFGPSGIKDFQRSYEDKYWWLQAEGTRALLRLAVQFPNDSFDYLGKFDQLWAYIQSFIVDRTRGGWCLMGRDARTAGRFQVKSFEWKDPSHEVLSLLECLELLKHHSDAVPDA